MRLMVRIALTFGRRATRALLYPICFYYFLFARRAVRYSRTYLTRALGRPATWRDVYRHYFVFASVLLDRAFLFAGRPQVLEISAENSELVRRLAAENRGCLLLGAHLGSFDVTRKLGHERKRIEVNMMMYEDNARKLNAVIDSVGGRARMKVIPIGQIDSLIRAKERLDHGEWVGILGDRAVDSDRLVRVPFLGAEAAFPAGPFLMASALRVPVVLFACVYLGGNRYKEHFELFTEELRIDRARRDADLEKWVRRYAERLEHYCRLAPYNWFNFYDFWQITPPATAPVRRASSTVMSAPVGGKPLHP